MFFISCRTACRPLRSTAYTTQMRIPTQLSIRTLTSTSVYQPTHPHHFIKENDMRPRSKSRLYQPAFQRYQHQHQHFTTSSKPEVTTSSKDKNLSVVIVGTGPSGCYTAKYLISSLRQLKSKLQAQQSSQSTPESSNDGNQNDNHVSIINNIQNIQIDMIDKLPTPFGLVRSGVAPDHPEVKNVENDFSKLFDDNETNSSASILQSSMEFRGNVTVGQDVSLPELQKLYDIVVLAYGCESDRTLGIEGGTNEGGGDQQQQLEGIFSAREFVAWYNGHPDFEYFGSKLKRVLDQNDATKTDTNTTGSKTQVVVIGQGNVALDCARVLAKGQRGLNDTDITSGALEVIQDGVHRTSVLGRRGHVQGAFTIKELRELTKMDDLGVKLVIDSKELDAGLTDASMEELKLPGSRPKVRIDKLLRDVSSDSIVADDDDGKEIKIRFLLNPVRFVSKEDDPSRLGSVICEHTRLEGDAGQQRAVGTGIMEEIPADVALVSIGYKGIQIPGLDDSLFDSERGVVKNVHGKVTEHLYVCGWLKRGPSGIIGTNLVDAKDTISSILKDLDGLSLDACEGRTGLDRLLLDRKVKFVDWHSFQKIDAAEKDPSRLRSKSQPREKFTNREDMLSHI